MNRLTWRRAVRADLPALAAFLAGREERCATFSDRLLRGSGGGREPRLPSPLRGGVWIAREEAGEGPGRGIAGTPAADEAPGGLAPPLGAVLLHPSGLAFPLLPERGPAAGAGAAGAAEDGLGRELARLSAARIWRAASAAGPASDVERFEAAAGLEPLVRVGYALMALPATRASGVAQRVGSGGPFSVRRAAAADLDALYPLQEAYEREEVLTPIHELNPAACRAALARSLEQQLVYVAEEPDGRGGSRIVAKAGTNARGFRVDQVGGVYTLPERRGRGAARALMAALLGEAGASGRDVALFVKSRNAPALGLYRGLGFEELCGYRADYFRES